MIFYVHGFNSCADRNRDKVQELARILGEEVTLLDYPSDVRAEDILGMLQAQVAEHAGKAPHFFIGSSLGAFWAERLAQIHGRPAALFNPCCKPVYFLRQFLGECEHFCTGKRWQFTESPLNSYAPLEAMRIDIPRQVFMATDDEVLDPALVKDHYAGVCDVVDFHGGHSVKSFRPFADKLVALRGAIRP